MDIKEALVALAMGKKIYLPTYIDWESFQIIEIEGTCVILRVSKDGKKNIDETMVSFKAHYEYYSEPPKDKK